jgi:hypothetical protein
MPPLSPSFAERLRQGITVEETGAFTLRYRDARGRDVVLSGCLGTGRIDVQMPRDLAGVVDPFAKIGDRQRDFTFDSFQGTDASDMPIETKRVRISDEVRNKSGVVEQINQNLLGEGMRFVERAVAAR